MIDTTGSGFDLDQLSRRLAAAGIATPIGIGAIDLGPSALARLPERVAALRPPASGAPIAVLTDAIGKLRQGEDVTNLVVQSLRAGAEVRWVKLPGKHGQVHADAATLDDAAHRVAGAACLVTAGSGTLADIGKAVSSRLDGLPHVVVQTALSVNGFADDQSVLLVDGVKRTTPTRWPDALLIDTAILADAPLALNLAGVGDLLAMFTAPADWRLANVLDMGDGYTAPVVSMLRDQGPALLAAAPRLESRASDALEVVAATLTLSGITMGVAGTTAPASGMEHTVSHLLEMAMNRRGRSSALHGAQVGVCAILASLTWRSIRASLRDGRPPHLVFPGEDEIEPRVRAAFDCLDPSGIMGQECWRLYRCKLRRWNDHRDRLMTVDWDAVDGAVADLLVEPEELAGTLARSGAPVRFRDLDPPIDAVTARWALTNCHWMRDRFTVGDLAFFLGRWSPREVDAILEQAAALGAGL